MIQFLFYLIIAKNSKMSDDHIYQAFLWVVRRLQLLPLRNWDDVALRHYRLLMIAVSNRWTWQYSIWLLNEMYNRPTRLNTKLTWWCWMPECCSRWCAEIIDGPSEKHNTGLKAQCLNRPCSPKCAMLFPGLPIWQFCNCWCVILRFLLFIWKERMKLLILPIFYVVVNYLWIVMVVRIQNIHCLILSFVSHIRRIIWRRKYILSRRHVKLIWQSNVSLFE